MISFNCEKCGQKVSAPDAHAGKKGKCPRCKSIMLIPEITEELTLKPLNENTDNADYRLNGPEEELRLQKNPSFQPDIKGFSADGLTVTNEFIFNPEVKEEPPKRKIPAILDVFLYPANMTGLINIFVFTGLSFLYSICSIFAGPICLVRLAFIIVGVTIFAYMLYYIIECIRDSAEGGIRAPENLNNMPTSSEALSQLWDMVISMILLWLPLTGYYIYRIATDVNAEYNPREDTTFWILLGYGVFFSPIALLTLAIFNSSSAYNPIVWIISVFSVFFQYCFIVLLFSGLAFLVSRIAVSLQGGLLSAAFFTAIFLYFAMIAAHILGRFYYKNAKKLNWEV